MLNSIYALDPGTTLNNKQLCDLFACSPQGGMRRSHKTNTLVIVSNHVKSIYDDRWLGEIFHYTGMGISGDQSLEFAQNRTLNESNSNGISVHLFEVFEEGEYTYIGPVELSSDPYFEIQPDESGANREVCIFPLKMKSGSTPAIRKESLQKAFEKKAQRARRLSDEQVEKRAKNAKTKVGIRATISQQYERDVWVAEHAKRQAKGYCQLCEKQAPFVNSAGEAYLETHHIVWIAKGGEDTIENTVALCPNCHRRMHVLNDKKDVDKLLARKFRKLG